MPPPLSIGTITLDDGDRVHGFLCEAIAVGEAADVTAYGGWRAYLANAAGRHRPCVTKDLRTSQTSV